MGNLPNIKLNINEIDIMIVEDEIVLAMAIEQSLLNMGFNVTGIEKDPNKAITHVQNRFPDLVLMDINLKSKQTGIDVANMIWKRFKIPIIFLTSYSNDKTIKEALCCEPYGYLIKPCKDAELKAAINMAIHKHKYFFTNRKYLQKEEKNLLFLEDDLKYDYANSELYKNNEKIKLTKNEKKLFYILSQNPGEIISFQTISSYIWREDIYDLGKLRTLIYRLKIKLGTNLFENMYEHGYKLKVKS